MIIHQKGSYREYYGADIARKHIVVLKAGNDVVALHHTKRLVVVEGCV